MKFGVDFYSHFCGCRTAVAKTNLHVAVYQTVLHTDVCGMEGRMYLPNIVVGHCRLDKSKQTCLLTIVFDCVIEAE